MCARAQNSTRSLLLSAYKRRDIHAELVLRDDGRGRARLPDVKPVAYRHLADHERGEDEEHAERGKLNPADLLTKVVSVSILKGHLCTRRH